MSPGLYSRRSSRRSSPLNLLIKENGRPIEVCYHLDDKARARKFRRRPLSKKPWIPPPGRATNVPLYQNLTHLWPPTSPIRAKVKKVRKYPMRISLEQHGRDHQPRNIVVSKKRPCAPQYKHRRRVKMERPMYVQPSPSEIATRTETVLYLDQIPDDESDDVLYYEPIEHQQDEIRQLKQQMRMVTRNLERISSKLNQFEKLFHQRPVVKEHINFHRPTHGSVSTSPDHTELTQRAKKLQNATKMASEVVNAYLRKQCREEVEEQPTHTFKLGSTNPVLNKQMNEGNAWIRKLFDSIRENRILAEKARQGEIKIREAYQKEAEDNEEALNVINDLLTHIVTTFTAVSELLARDGDTKTPDLTEKTKLLKKVFAEFLNVVGPAQQHMTQKDRTANELLNHCVWLQKLHNEYIDDEESAKDVLARIHSSAEEFSKDLFKKKRKNQKLKEAIVDKASELAKINVKVQDYHVKQVPQVQFKTISQGGKARTNIPLAHMPRIEKKRLDSEVPSSLADHMQILEKSVYGLLPVLEHFVPKGKQRPFHSLNKDLMQMLNETNTNDIRKSSAKTFPYDIVDLLRMSGNTERDIMRENWQTSDFEDIVKDISDRNMTLGEIAQKHGYSPRFKYKASAPDYPRGSRNQTRMSQQSFLESGPLSALESGPLSALESGPLSSMEIGRLSSILESGPLSRLYSQNGEQSTQRQHTSQKSIPRSNYDQSLPFSKNNDTKPSVFSALSPNPTITDWDKLYSTVLENKDVVTENELNGRGRNSTRTSNDMNQFQNHSPGFGGTPRNTSTDGSHGRLRRKSSSMTNLPQHIITSTPKATANAGRVPKRILEYPEEEHDGMSYPLSRQRGSTNVSVTEEDITAATKKMNLS